MKVINIMPHPPAYTFMTDMRPAISWDQPDGTWVGMETWDWSDQLGAEVLKLRSDVQYEVWQPDYKAHQVYTHMGESGVRRKLFPATNHVYAFSFGRRTAWFSQPMVEALDEGLAPGTVLHLNSWRDPFTLFLSDRYRNRDSFGFFVSGHGGPSTPKYQRRITRHPLKLWALYTEQSGIRRYIERFDAISDQNEEVLDDLRVFFPRIQRLTMGVDFAFWKPCPDEPTKRMLRQKHGIEDQLVIFSGSNLIPRKQLDRFITVLDGLVTEKPFLFIIAGRGESSYEQLLHKLGRNLIEKGWLRFFPYLRDEQLRELYWLSDLYASVATQEGASVAIMQAFATGLPVFSSDAGGTADAMKEWGCNVIVPRFDYQQWAKELKEVLNGRLPSPVDRGKAKQRFDWPVVARQFLGVYDKLWKRTTHGYEKADE